MAQGFPFGINKVYLEITTTTKTLERIDLHNMILNITSVTLV